MKALDAKYSMPAMLFILQNGQCFKKDLYSVVTSPNTLDKLLDILQDAGLITMKEEMKGRRTYLISLSATGRRVAKKLKEIDGLLSKQTEVRRELTILELIASFETLRNINGHMGMCNSMTLVFCRILPLPSTMCPIV